MAVCIVTFFHFLLVLKLIGTCAPYFDTTMWKEKEAEMNSSAHCMFPLNDSEIDATYIWGERYCTELFAGRAFCWYQCNYPEIASELCVCRNGRSVESIYCTPFEISGDGMSPTDSSFHCNCRYVGPGNDRCRSKDFSWADAETLFSLYCGNLTDSLDISSITNQTEVQMDVENTSSTTLFEVQRGIYTTSVTTGFADVYRTMTKKSSTIIIDNTAPLAYDDTCDNRTIDDQHRNVEGDQHGDNIRMKDRKAVQISESSTAQNLIYSNTREITNFASQSIMNNSIVQSMVTNERQQITKADSKFGYGNDETITVPPKLASSLPVPVNEMNIQVIDDVTYSTMIGSIKVNNGDENIAIGLSDEIVSITDWNTVDNDLDTSLGIESTSTLTMTTTDTKPEKNDPKHFKKKAEIDPVLLDISANSELLNSQTGNRQRDTFAQPPADFDI